MAAPPEPLVPAPTATAETTPTSPHGEPAVPPTTTSPKPASSTSDIATRSHLFLGLRWRADSPLFGGSVQAGGYLTKNLGLGYQFGFGFWSLFVGVEDDRLSADFDVMVHHAPFVRGRTDSERWTFDLGPTWGTYSLSDDDLDSGRFWGVHSEIGVRVWRTRSTETRASLRVQWIRRRLDEGDRVRRDTGITISPGLSFSLRLPDDR